MEFVQTIWFKSTKIDEIRKLDNELKDVGIGNPTGYMLKDREHEDQYLVVLRFDSYDDAMKNSELPETQAFAAKMAELCDGAPAFANFDVLERID